MSDIRIGLIGGSGLGTLLGGPGGEAQARHEIDTPFGRPSDAIFETQWAGLPVFLLARHGPGHLLNPSQVPYRANLFALKTLGVTHVIASGAVGSLREEFKPRDLVVPDQVIDKTSGRRAGTFFEKAAVHVEFAEPFCPVLRAVLLEAGRREAAGDPAPPAAAEGAEAFAPAAPFAIHDRGCYVCMEGPAFSTRAESLMHRLWGGDLIGMTAMPEAKLAREAEMSYALVALVTDYDCWRQAAPPLPPSPPATGAPGTQTATVQPAPTAPPPPEALLEEIIGNLQAASANALRVMRRAVEFIAERRETLEPGPARDAMRLAIWSDKAAIDADEVKRLGSLWMKYFG